MTSRKVFPRETPGIYQTRHLPPGTVPVRPAAPAMVMTDKTKHTIHPTPRGRFEADPGHVGDFSREWAAARAKPKKAVPA